MSTKSERPDDPKPIEEAASTPEASTPDSSEAESTHVAASDDAPASAEAPSRESAEAPSQEVEAESVADEASEPAAEVVMQEAAAAATPESDEDAVSDTSEQAAAMEGDERLGAKLKPGQRMQVKLVQVGEKDAFLDYGGAAEGTIALSELKDDKGELRVQMGESFDAIVRKVDEPVEFTVGRSRGGDLLRMRELASAHEGQIPVQGKIKSTNKGGFEVDLQGVRAFCPFSQIDTVYCERPEDHVGNSYTFEIIAFERGGKNIVLSRRRLIEEEAKASADKTRETLAIGQQLEGLVRRLQPYGAFVDIGGVDGLVHVSEISRGHVANPRDVLKVGDRVKVQVIGIEDLGGSRERVSLSMKVLEKDPWESAAEKWVPGSIVKGRVVRLTDFGAFVELAAGVDGLVHVSEISTERIGHPSDVLAPQQEVDVRILAVDPESRRISLTMRPEGEERAPRSDDHGERRGVGGGGRGRRPRPDREPEPESYTFTSEEKVEPQVDVKDLDYDDALELLKQKFNQQ